MRTLKPFVTRVSRQTGAADSFATHWSFPIATPVSSIVRTLIVAPEPAPVVAVVAYTLPAVYPPPAKMTSTSVTPPVPAPDGEGEADADEEIELEGEREMEVEREVEGEIDGEGEGELEIEVEGDAEDDTEFEIEVETEVEADGDTEGDREDEIESEGEDETDVEGERKSICVTRTIALLSAFPFSPAASVRRSPTAYPVPVADAEAEAIESIVPSKNSTTDVAAAPASCKHLMTVFLIGRKRLLVAEIGSVFAIVFG